MRTNHRGFLVTEDGKKNLYSAQPKYLSFHPTSHSGVWKTFWIFTGVRKNFAGVDEIVMNVLWAASFGSPQPGQWIRVLLRAHDLCREKKQLNDRSHMITYMNSKRSLADPLCAFSFLLFRCSPLKTFQQWNRVFTVTILFIKSNCVRYETTPSAYVTVLCYDVKAHGGRCLFFDLCLFVGMEWSDGLIFCLLWHHTLFLQKVCDVTLGKG